MKTRVLACMVTFAFLLAVQSALAQADKLIGVWKLTELQLPIPPGVDQPVPAMTNPQPSIVIFIKKHFSMTMITGNEPRPVLSKDATKEELRKALASFASAAGTYEVEGSILTLNLNVSWAPNYTDKPAPQEFRFEGDDGAIRILYFFYLGGKIIFLNGFKKKKKKIPRKEIELAKRRKEDFLVRLSCSIARK